MVEKRKPKKEDMSDIIAKAESVQEGPDLYSNHVQLNITKTELNLDFFNLRVHYMSSFDQKPLHLQRIILSLNNAKGLATALANLIDKFEGDTNIILPNLRVRTGEDKIELWKEQSTNQETEEKTQEESSQ